jgi:hypothetical protein
MKVLCKIPAYIDSSEYRMFVKRELIEEFGVKSYDIAFRTEQDWVINNLQIEDYIVYVQS